MKNRQVRVFSPFTKAEIILQIGAAWGFAIGAGAFMGLEVGLLAWAACPLAITGVLLVIQLPLLLVEPIFLMNMARRFSERFEHYSYPAVAVGVLMVTLFMAWQTFKSPFWLLALPFVWMKDAIQGKAATFKAPQAQVPSFIIETMNAWGH